MQLNFMLKLGDYYEDDAKSIADYLRKAGIKVEIKPSIDASIEIAEFLQGLFSELKADITDKNIIEKHERYIVALKKVIETKPSVEEFSERYLKELFPTIDDVRTRLREARERMDRKEDGTIATDEEKGRIIGVEEGAKLKEEFEELMSEMEKIFTEGQKAKAFAFYTLSLNKIEPGEDVGRRLDDPIVAIPVDLDDYGMEHPRAKRVISVYLDKSYEIYVDEFSTIHSEKVDDEFIERYTDEHIIIKSIAMLLTDLIKNHSSERMDLEAFEDECSFVKDSKNRTLRVIGDYVAEDIAKILEKNGMIKMKGDIIRWKR